MKREEGCEERRRRGVEREEKEKTEEKAQLVSAIQLLLSHKFGANISLEMLCIYN